MSNSSSRSEFAAYPALLGSLLVVAALLQSWHQGWSAFVLVWLLPLLLLLVLWHVKLQSQQHCVQQIRAIAQEVAKAILANGSTVCRPVVNCTT